MLIFYLPLLNTIEELLTYVDTFANVFHPIEQKTSITSREGPCPHSLLLLFFSHYRLCFSLCLGCLCWVLCFFFSFFFVSFICFFLLLFFPFIENNNFSHIIFNFDFYLSMWFAYMCCMQHICAGYTLTPEEGIGCHGSGGTNSCESPYGAWELYPGTLQEQQVLIPAEWSLQLLLDFQNHFFFQSVASFL